MTTSLAFSVRNGQCVLLSAVPHVNLQAFQHAIVSAVHDGLRVASLFGMDGGKGAVRLYAVLANDTAHTLTLLTTEVGTGEYASLTPDCPQVHLFEREIWEQTGLTPIGHPRLAAVRRHDVVTQGGDPRHPFFPLRGEEAHEVAVGPIHAGVIEPGHFRFQCHGETVHNLDIHLGYQHRGVEEALLDGPTKRTVHYMETVAGDTTVGNAMAYAQVVEALSATDVPDRARALRAAALELERLANHVGDMGALANDVGFLPTSAYCGRLRGEFLNITAMICGHRLGRSLVRPGGVRFDVDDKMASEVLNRLDKAERDVKNALELFFNTGSVLNRVEGTGKVSKQACLDLGFVGMAARSTGVRRDTRVDHPSGWFARETVEPAVFDSGDVYARARVRKVEIARSIAYVRKVIADLPSGATAVTIGDLAPSSIVVSMVEGWRGELCHVAITDRQGRFARYKLVDPSFHNWTALSLALRNEQISDFPLCNKSFNLSYCGFDL